MIFFDLHGDPWQTCSSMRDDADLDRGPHGEPAYRLQSIPGIHEGPYDRTWLSAAIHAGRVVSGAGGTAILCEETPPPPHQENCNKLGTYDEATIHMMVRAAFLWGGGSEYALESLPADWKRVLRQAGIPMDNYRGKLLPRNHNQ